jgi:hypothetical protein
MPRLAHDCTRCGRTHTSPKYLLCLACRLIERKRAAAILAEVQADGVCSICRKAEADDGMRTCVPCRDHQRKLNARAVRRAQRNGTCVTCKRTDRAAAPGKASCGPCLEKRRRQHARTQRRLRGELRADNRDRLIETLAIHGAMDLYQLAERASMSTRTVLRHLRKLEPAGKVAHESIGAHSKKVYFSICGARR